MSQEINEGDEVRHALFGDGRVISVDPNSSIATIDFVAAGRKRMLASSSMEILSRGQIFTARQEQSMREQEQARREQEQAKQKAEDAKQQARKIAQQDYLDRAAIRKKQEERVRETASCSTGSSIREGIWSARCPSLGRRMGQDGSSP